MRTQILFKNIEGLEHIRTHIEDASARFIGKFERARNGLRTDIIVGLTRGRNVHHPKPVFECELVVGGKDLSKPIVVKKYGANFYSAIQNCLKSGEKVLRRISKRRVSKRQHSEIYEDDDLSQEKTIEGGLE